LDLDGFLELAHLGMSSRKSVQEARIFPFAQFAGPRSVLDSAFTISETLVRARRQEPCETIEVVSAFGIDFDSPVVVFDSLLIFVLHTPSNPTVILGASALWIQPEGFRIVRYRLIVFLTLTLRVAAIDSHFSEKTNVAPRVFVDLKQECTP